MTPPNLYGVSASLVTFAAAGLVLAEHCAARRRDRAVRPTPVAPWDHTGHDALDLTPIPSPAPRPPDEVSSPGAIEAPMSTISKIKDEFETFLTGILAKLPAESHPEVQAAATSVTTAISATEAALVSTAETAAVPALSTAISKDVPVEFQPLASLALQLGIAALTAKAGL